MGLINDADAVYMGGVPVGKVYSGHIQVWPPPVVDTANVTLVVNDPQHGAYVRATGSFNGQTPDQWRFYLSENGGSWQLKKDGAASTVDIATSWETECWVKVETLLGGQLLATGYSNKVTTGSEPPPATTQKQVTLSRASDWKSWKGDGTQRTDTDGRTYGFSGYFSSNWGNQSCSFRFAIPSDLRNCVSVDKVEVSIWNDHSYNASGRQVYLGLHHYSSLGSSDSGGTNSFGNWHAVRDGWVGGNPGWIDITNLVCPGRYSVKEEFRVHGADGIRIMQGPSNSQSYYGYVRNDVRMRFTYTVYA